MKKVLQKLLICIPFLFIIFGVTCGTLYSSLSNVMDTVRQDGFDVNMAESFMKEKMLAKQWFCEISGIIQKLTGHRMTSDGEFYRGSDNIMHLKRDDVEYDALIESTGQLADMLAEKDIPFLVCQIAERAFYGDPSSKFLDGNSLKYLEPLKDALAARKTPYLNSCDFFKEEGFSSKEIFLKTDFHCTTRAEFLVLEKVVAALEKEYGLCFPDKNTVLNLENYKVEEYDFIGNLGYTHGVIFSGKDCFQYFLPNFETNLSLENPSQGVSKTGGFETVCMNGYRDKPEGDDSTIYRVTDYMQWPSPYYTIDNHLSKGPHIVVIGDSLSIRTTAYLTLLCRRVTVIDPRYFNGHNYLQDIDFHQVDAVVFFPSINISDGINAYDAEVQSCRCKAKGNGEFDLYVTVKNTGMVSWRPEDDMKMGVWTDENDSGMRADLSEGRVIAPEDSVIVVFRGLNLFSMSQDTFVQMLRKDGFPFGEREKIMESSLSGEMISILLDHLPEAPAQTADYWIGTQGLCIDTCNGGPSAERMMIQPDAQQVELVGWAADFNALQPLSALYLQVGEHVIPCSYGLERVSVSDHFGNENLKNTGFTVTFPAAYVEENATGTIAFIPVSADGAYRYEPIEFGLAFPPTPLADFQSEPVSAWKNGSWIELTVKNTSQSVWTEKNMVRAGVFSNGQDTGLRGYLPSGKAVEPGETVIFRIFLEGREALFTTVLEATMLQESISYFGERILLPM